MAKPDYKAYLYNSVHMRNGKIYAVAVNAEGKTEDEVEFPTLEEAQEFCHKSMNYA